MPIQIYVNGQARDIAEAATAADLLAELDLVNRRVALELNQSILPRSQYAQQQLNAGDTLEIVHAIGGGQATDAPLTDAPLTVAGKIYGSRLLVGTGKYQDLDETRLAIKASGADIVTVALRRTNIGQNPGEPNLLEVIPPEKYTILPNTAGCYTAKDAVRTCQLARELLDGHTLVKLEVLGDEKTLYPDIPATLAAAKTLVADGFEVMVYTSDDPIIAKKLEDLGCVAVMPLAAPIGSGLGIQNPYNILTILENASVPIIVDAGVGTASDAAVAMELGCEGVLMNTAIAGARDPIRMAQAMKYAVQAGRDAFLAGRIPKKRYATASSPIDGTFF